MASLAVAGLISGGSLTAGSTAAIISSVAATYIDTAIVTPALFPPADTEGPRIDSFGFNSGSEHAPMWRVFGEDAVRVPATVIWLGPLQEKKVSEDAGKGGGGSFTTYLYFADLAWAWCLGPIDSVLKIKSDGRVLYGLNEGQDVTSDAIAITSETILNADGDVEQTWMVLTTSDVKFNKFKSGQDVTVSNASNGGNNGTFLCVSAKRNKSTGVSTMKLVNASVVVEAAGATIQVQQGLPQSQVNKAAQIDHMLGYNDAAGANAQDPSTLIEAEEGTGQVPAFRNTAYTTVDRLAMRPFGNRVPQAHGIIKPAASQTVGEAIEAALALTNLTSAQYDASGITDTLRGWGIRGQQSMSQAIGPLLVAYDLVVQEANQKITFRSRSSLTAIEIPAEDLSAHEEGSDAARPMTITDIEGTSLPSEVNVSYLDPLTDYQQASQRYRRSEYEADNTWDIRLPLTLSAIEAQDIARRLLWTAYANRRQASLSLAPKWIKLRPSDLIRVTAFGEVHDILLTRVEVGANFMIRAEGIVETSSALTFDNSAPDEPTDPDPLGPYIPPTCQLYILDIPAMRDEEMEVVGFYSAVCALDSTAQWQGAAVYQAALSGGTFNQLYSVEDEASMGIATDTSSLNDSPNVGYMDRVSSVTVEMYDGELESITELELLNGGNRMVIGNEIIGFQTATLQPAADTYVLTNLLRGLRDTDDHTTHANYEQVVFLNDQAVGFVNTSTVNIGNSKFMKPIPAGADVDDFSNEVPITSTANTVRPFRVMDVRGERDGSNNLTITWIRRSRAFTAWMKKPVNFEAGTLSMDDDETGWYEIDVYDGPDTSTDSVVRTLYVSNGTNEGPGVTSETYTAANQTTDGLTPGDAITVIIYKMSAVVGRGNGTEATV